LEAPAEQADPAAKDHRPGGMPQARAAVLWCSRCGQPVKLADGDGIEDEYRKAVHAATGRETGPDGHLAAPVDHEPPLWKDARELAAEYGGVFAVTARFGFLRAEWSHVRPGALAAHFEADDREQMRRKLDAAIDARRDRDMAALARDGSEGTAR
jgi:hypothetical protein